MQRIETVWIVNGNVGEPHRDRYDGDEYEFPYMQATEVPASGAELMFGYGVESKVSTLMRSGRAPTSRDVPEGLKWLNGFSFHADEQAAHRWIETKMAEADPQFAPRVVEALAAVPETAVAGVVSQQKASAVQVRPRA